MKYYRVRNDTFLWQAGAILHKNDAGGYVAIEDVWDSVPIVYSEYISASIVEHEGNAEFFERVYPDSVSGKIFRTKDQLVAAYDGAFKK